MRGQPVRGRVAYAAGLFIGHLVSCAHVAVYLTPISQADRLGEYVVIEGLSLLIVRQHEG